MSSARSVGFHWFCVRYLPFLLKRCKGGNLHFIQESKCHCMVNEHCGNDGGCVYIWSWLKWQWLKEPKPLGGKKPKYIDKDTPELLP